jgi:hypothetical protein
MTIRQQITCVFSHLYQWVNFAFVVLVVYVVSACTSQSVPNPEVASESADSLITPETGSIPVSPLVTPEIPSISPVPQSPVPTPFVIESQATAVVPTQLTITQAIALKPEAGTGLVVGRLIDAATGMPASYIWVYLAGVIGPDDAPQVVLDISVAPLSITNENGVFYFQNVRPDKYGVVVWDSVSSSLLTEPDSDHSLLFSLQAGEVKNLQDLTAYIP